MKRKERRGRWKGGVIYSCSDLKIHINFRLAIERLIFSIMCNLSYFRSG